MTEWKKIVGTTVNDDNKELNDVNFNIEKYDN